MTAAIPSLFGMLVSNDMTSAVTKDPLVRRGGSFSKRLRKCLVSLMRD